MPLRKGVSYCTHKFTIEQEDDLRIENIREEQDLRDWAELNCKIYGKNRKKKKKKKKKKRFGFFKKKKKVGKIEKEFYHIFLMLSHFLMNWNCLRFD